MSHFIVLVFHKENGRDVDELLAPYDESIVMAPYVKYTREQAIASVRKEIEEDKLLYEKCVKDPEGMRKTYNIDYILKNLPKRFNWTDDQCYEEKRKWFEDDMIEANGDLLSTYNPNSKWDWYITGGRWTGYFKNKSGEETNEDYASEIIWDDKTIPFAFVTPNGIWHEKGEMGWWAMVSNEKEKDDWNTEFKEFLKSLDDNVIVTAVDCHI